MMRRLLCLVLLSPPWPACSALPDKPARQAVYDFGPPPAAGRRRHAAPAGAGAAGAGGERHPGDHRPAVSPGVRRPLPAAALCAWRAGVRRPAQLLAAEAARRARRVSAPCWTKRRRRRWRGAVPSVPLVLRVRAGGIQPAGSTRPATARACCGCAAPCWRTRAAGERFVAQRGFDVERPAPSADAAGRRARSDARPPTPRRGTSPRWLEQR